MQLGKHMVGGIVFYKHHFLIFKVPYSKNSEIFKCNASSMNLLVKMQCSAWRFCPLSWDPVCNPSHKGMKTSWQCPCKCRLFIENPAVLIHRNVAHQIFRYLNRVCLFYGATKQSRTKLVQTLEQNKHRLSIDS